ncbi:MAG TPA: hypothetical protein VGQ69_12180 [Gemmatimonadales bacterium]|jgi:hypothetical protein|nr:hypothetical protein [Gemmatimonadales bacterium]
MSQSEPRRGWLLALLIFVAAALTLCWPMLAGKVINGSDFYLAGWGFRHFGAEYFKQHHAIPLWNPLIFGGMPYVAGMHGDIFYPTAWLRWLLPLTPATNLTFGGHIVLAGVTMYTFLRGLKLSWTAAVAGGLAYELSGIVASMVHPGHDGKLFVSAIAPLLLLGLLRGIRERKLAGYGVAALAVGLALHGHPQPGYYLLVAAGIWTLFLVFWDEQRPRGRARYHALAWSALAVVLGIGIYAIQLLPLLAYVPYSPRGAGGPSGGWEYATGFAMPPAEIFSTFYPQLNGMIDAYAGANRFKLHTEHLGVVVILLAVCGLGGAERRRERIALGVIGTLFLLVAFGGHTPFYRLWYELMPTQKSVRAVGSAFYLVALPIAALAGYGAERLLTGQVSARRIWIGAGVFALIGLFGASGALGGLAQSLADPQLVQVAVQNAPSIQSGGIRLLLFTLAGAGVLYAIRRQSLRGAAAALALVVVLWGDLWSVDRRFFTYGNAEELFGEDEVTATMRKTPLPYRVWDPRGRYAELETYPGSWLMGRGVPQLLGYHGNELRRFDELFGGKNDWANQPNRGLLELFAVRYVVLRQRQTLPGYHEVLGPVAVRTGGPAVLYEADTIPSYVRLMAGAVKVPDVQAAEVVADPRFPALKVAVYSDSERVSPAELAGQLPAPAAATAKLLAWQPGKMRIAIEGRDERPLYLVVAENWYKDWEAEVDGAATPVLRAQHTMLSVLLPPGAKEVSLEFRSKEYQRGKLITLAALLGAAALLIGQRIGQRTSNNG